MATAETKAGMAVTPVDKFVSHMGALQLNVADTIAQFGVPELSRVAKKFGRFATAPAIRDGVLRINVSTVDHWMPYEFTFIERDPMGAILPSRARAPLRYACEVPDSFLGGRAPKTLLISGEVADVLTPSSMGPKQPRSIKIPLTGNHAVDVQSVRLAAMTMQMPRLHGSAKINPKAEASDVEDYRKLRKRWKRDSDPAMADLLRNMSRLHTPFTETVPGVRKNTDTSAELSQRRYYGLVALVDCLVKRGTKRVVVKHMGPVNPAIDAVFLACANLTADVELVVECPTVGEVGSMGTTRLWTLYATTLKLTAGHYSSLAWPELFESKYAAGLTEVKFEGIQQSTRGAVHPFAAFAVLLPVERLAPQRDPQHITLVSTYSSDLPALSDVMMWPGKKDVVLVMQPFTPLERFVEAMSGNLELLPRGSEADLTLTVQWPHSQTGGRLNPLRLT